MRCMTVVVLLLLAAAAAFGAQPVPTAIPRAANAITIDGIFSEAEWRSAAAFDLAYNTWPDDNTPAQVKTTAYLAYDSRFLYVAFVCEDPHPERIRAPLVERDHVGLDQDFVDIVLDTRNDSRTGYEFAVNARNIQMDGIFDDSTMNEDYSPDYFWDSATAITATGYVVEMRIPYSSLRYSDAPTQTWGITFRRNYNRVRQYRFANVPWPHNSSCFVCRESKITGLTGLPHGSHYVAAPYASAKEEGVARRSARSEWLNKPVQPDGGLDAKWVPNQNTAVDATVNPDFSQVESDVAQISVNERFALLYPEKRPFFLEGNELFATPIQVIYTRTITSPNWGARSTGKFGDNAYTFLVAQDRGGGSVVLPGPVDSQLSPQDFMSFAAIGRFRHDLGRSFAGFVLTDREAGSSGHNRVFGPDYQWTPNDTDRVSGQLLLSDTWTPAGAAPTTQWSNTHALSGAFDLSWWHTTRAFDWYAETAALGDRFRADDGFVPQAGYRHATLTVGRSFWPTNFFLSRQRVFLDTTYDTDTGGKLINRQLLLGTGMDAPLDTFLQFRYAFDRVRSGDRTLPRQRFLYVLQMRPSNLLPWVDIEGNIGRQIDFANSRTGTGGDITANISVQPTNHFRLDFNGENQWLDVAAGERSGRLFTAQVERVKATYNFAASTFVRLIAQRISTRRNALLYNDPSIARMSTDVTLSALFGYRLNWQSVIFVGYGDNSALDQSQSLARTSRQFFIKLSYAFQG